MRRISGYDHVVLVSIDTLRSDALGANPFPLWPHRYPGLRPPATQVLDELAGRGAFFPNMITAAPYTAAAHGAIFSGRYPLHNGLHEFYGGRLLSPSVFTYARRAGRRTVLNVDFPVILGPELGFTKDVDVYLTEQDEKFVDAVAASETTLACAHFGAVHVPYGFHNERFGGDAYRAKVDELEAMVPKDLGFIDRLVESRRDDQDNELMLRYKRAVGYLHSQGEYEQLFQLYLDGVEHFLTTRFRVFVERLTERVGAAGKRLLLVIFADHGEDFDEDTNGHFNSMAEGVLRVPLIIVGDEVAPGVHGHRVRTVDIAPTVLDLAGIAADAPPDFDGVSLAAVVRGEAELTADRPAFATAYTSDLNELIDYQERRLRGEEPGPVKHVLVGQCGYLGDRRIIRVGQRYRESFTRMDPVELGWIERFDEGRVPRVDADGDPTALRAALDGYMADEATARDVQVTADIRERLRALGYSI
jgi:choline-sulfatase